VPTEPANRGRKKFSVRTRAKMAAAQKARWAAKRGEVAKPIEVESKATPAAKANKKQVSEAKLKALAKAREARWAKMRAVKKAQSNEKPKKKRKMTAAWRKALERAWAARRAKGKAAGTAKV